MKVGRTDELSQEAWDRGEVGSWYGSWTHLDWLDAHRENNKSPWNYLKNLEAHPSLGWGDWLPSLAPIRRFIDIPEGDWAVVYLRDKKQIGLGKISGPMHSDGNHPLNRFGEIFKYIKIIEKKTFELSKIPDAYRILPTQGRQGNIHRFKGMEEHAMLLAVSKDEDDLNEFLNKKSIVDVIDFLGPTAWESYALAYLILEEGFVPTGLAAGGTLPTFDIVGRSIKTNKRILAQCKKSNNPLAIEEFPK